MEVTGRPPMHSDGIPPRGTPAYEWWRQGAKAEADARDNVPRTDEGRKVFDYVNAVTEHHHNRSGVDIGLSIVAVFSAPRTLCDRLRLTWRTWRLLR